LPEEQPYWDLIRDKAIETCSLYGYKRIDTPAFEDSGLFVRSIGEGTDIVEKEMYTFEDRSGDQLTLRPEGTAPVCRAYVQHGMQSLPQPVRLYYLASIFRYERPQAGRYREHHQFGAEAIGDGDPALDAEIIDMAWRLYAGLGLHGLALHLNSIGCKQCRPDYLNSLRGYYSQQQEALCSDCKRRLATNTLRLLDCKNPQCAPLAEGAPRNVDCLCQECVDHFERLKRYLGVLDLPYTLDHRLVRGLDYYNRTVFEIAPEGETGSQAAIGGGGRYDGLIEELGGRPTPAVGFGTGIERLVLNLKKQRAYVPESASPKVFVAYLGNEAKEVGMKLASFLRKRGVSVLGVAGERSLKSQLKRADAAGSSRTMIVGENEVSTGTVIVRNMSTGVQAVKHFDPESTATLTAEYLITTETEDE
jgi:histidyl-tRNA synthetase